MNTLFLIKNVVLHQLEGVYKDLLQVQELCSILLMGNLLKRDGFVGEGAETSFITRTILRKLTNELAFVAKIEHCTVLVKDYLG